MIVLILLNYNDYESTSLFLKQVQDFDSLYKIIVVDNKSTDDSYDKLLLLQNEKVLVLQTGCNKGYAAGNNFGIKYAVSKFNPDYLVVSNPDVIFSEDVLKHIIDVLNSNERLAICSATMVNANGSVFTNFASRLPHYSDLMLSCFQGIVQFRNKILHHSEYPSFSKIKGDKVYYTDVVPGSFFVANRKLFENVDFFDERTFLYYEENILAYKLLRKGYKEAILTDEVYYHLHSVSINKNIRKQYVRSKIMLDSAKIYLSIIGKGRIKVFLYEVLYWIGFPERVMFSYLSKALRGKKGEYP